MISFAWTLLSTLIMLTYNLEHWPSHFKTLISIIILKPNKSLYDLTKSFCPIVLLNMLGKLIEKVIREKLQFYYISNNFIHLYQFGELEQQSTSDMDSFLLYIIWSGWVKNIQSSSISLSSIINSSFIFWTSVICKSTCLEIISPW